MARARKEPITRFVTGDSVVVSEYYLKSLRLPEGKPSRLQGLVGTITLMTFPGQYEVDFGIPTPKYGRTPSFPTWLVRDEDLEPAKTS